MELSDPLAWLIIAGSFASSAISAAFAVGGGFLMLAIVTSVIPISAVVPVHSATLLGTSVGRSLFFFRHVDWSITRPFIIGALIGAPLGARIYFNLPESVIAAVIGCMMLVTVWAPTIRWRPYFSHPFFYVGIVHTFLSSLFSFGGLMQALMLRTKLLKMQVIGTLAVSLLVMNVFKLIGYFSFGFDFKPYLGVIIAATCAGIPGALLGRRLVNSVSEEKFRLLFKIIMTAFAFRLLYRAWLAV